MKKLFTVAVLTILCFLYSESINAQAFEKGQKNLSIGVGAGYGLGVNVGVDYGISELISIGAIGAFSSRNYGYLFDDYRVTYISFGGRAAVHFGKYLKEIGINEDKLDPYVGAVGGFRTVKYNDAYYSYYSGTRAGLMLGGYVGARYYLKDKIAIYAEGGVPYSSLGISLKF